LTFALLAPASAADPIADATARMLAGLPVEESAATGRVSRFVLAEHASKFQNAWAQLEQRQLSKIRAWGPQFLGESYSDNAPMFYMFSGPDFLYANAFFPAANTYILCGIEPVGAIPDLVRIPQERSPAALANLRKSLESVLSWSFFITKNMKADFAQTQLNGTLPVLYVFLARAGYTIESVENVALDRSGNFTPPGGRGATPGAKIVFSSRGGALQTLYYFSSDLSDSGIQANPWLHALLRGARAAVRRC
jgi:hypothetical protein